MTAEDDVKKPSAISGFGVILLATLLAGVVAYFITWLVPRVIGLGDYAAFAVFWSAIYLVVAALFGVQQEVTRSTRPLPPGSAPQVSRARNFGVVAGLVVFFGVLATAPLWVAGVFPTAGWGLVWPLAVGTASFVMVAVLGGSFYGVSAWRAVGLMIATDAVTRLVTLSIALALTHDVVVLAWAVAAPFPLTIVILWPFVRRQIVGRSQLDVGYRELTWNVARTVVAAASTGIMVSGFPLLLGLTSHDEPKAVVGLYILTITLTRAPLIVVTMSLQSFLTVRFRDNAEHFWREFLRIQAIVVGAAVVLAAGGWILGPAVFSLLFPGSLRPGGWFIAVMVLSSGLMASLCVTAPAVLARGRHVIYTAGWIVAALVTIGALLLPLDFTLRTILALLCGPVAGLLVQGGYLAASGRRERRPVEA